MAIAQDLKVGDSLQLDFGGTPAPVVLPITGILNLDQADALFSSATENENALVSDVVLVDISWFLPHLQASLATAAVNPPATLLPGAIILDPQIAHQHVTTSSLPAEPAPGGVMSAPRLCGAPIEHQFTGQRKAVDKSLRSSAPIPKADIPISAKILFHLFGFAAGVGPSRLSCHSLPPSCLPQRSAASSDLLRTRGATPRQVTGIIAVASVLLAIGGFRPLDCYSVCSRCSSAPEGWQAAP